MYTIFGSEWIPRGRVEDLRSTFYCKKYSSISIYIFFEEYFLEVKSPSVMSLMFCRKYSSLIPESGPFQIWDTIAQHDEIQLKDYPKENAYNLSLNRQNQTRFWTIPNLRHYCTAWWNSVRRLSKGKLSQCKPKTPRQDQTWILANSNLRYYCTAWWN